MPWKIRHGCCWKSESSQKKAPSGAFFISLLLSAPTSVYRPWATTQETDMAYVDGFVIPVPKDKLEAYKDMARRCQPIWKEYGAIGYAECVGDDVPYGEITSFPRAVLAEENETVIFSWVVYPSRAVRDAANEKIKADPRLKDMMENSPFNPRRMIFGGFESFIGP
jgi:uncharacterized protein YbaA (DUF1428 family)